MQTKAFAAALVAMPLLAGCIIIDDDGDGFDYQVDLNDRNSEFGSVFGATIINDAATFQVSSNGCTDKSYFEVDVFEIDRERYAIALDRVRADTCDQPISNGVDVTYTFAELGLPTLADVRVKNPVRRR